LKVSNCCTALPYGHPNEFASGLCGACFEPAEFEDDEVFDCDTCGLEEMFEEAIDPEEELCNECYRRMPK